MQDTDDLKLLRDYGQHGSEAAFTELVQRHIGLVYSSALRRVGVAVQAEEITQAVFIILARKAGGLRAGIILESWLYETTRLTTLSFLRGERRRHFREQEAYMQSQINPSGHDDGIWRQFAPLLDEAMMRLNQRDRDALLLRFFKNQSVRDVAAALQINESAAQQRILRGVGRLRAIFIKQGVTFPAALLIAAISANSAQGAPIALTKSVTAVALAKGAAASGSTLTLIKGALKIMAWTKAKTTVVAGVILLLAVGTTTVAVKYYNRHATKLSPTPANLASFERETSRLVNDAKWTTLACALFAGSHQNRLPENFAELNASAVGVNNVQYQRLSDADWLFVAGGNKDSFASPDTTIYFLEKEPRQSPNGKFFKVYATVNGRVFSISSPGKDFTAAEKERGFLIQRTKN